MKRIPFLYLALLPATALAQSEEWFARKAHAEIGGQLEVRLEDGTRCDLLTDTHAYEVEAASNWKEAIGQSLHYALVTDRKAGIILITRSATCANWRPLSKPTGYRSRS